MSRDNLIDDEESVHVDIVASNSDPAAAQPQAGADHGVGAPAHDVNSEVVFEDVFLGKVNGGSQESNSQVC